VLREASRSEPLLVFLDDLQWVDDSSLFLLQFLARNLECERILFLGAYRDGGAFEP
jgi:predicted ATPase